MTDLGELFSFHALIRKNYDNYIFCGSRENLIKRVLSFCDTPSRILEFGVFDGAMTRFLCEQSVFSDFEYHGFDTFEGLPDVWLRNGVVYRPRAFFNLDGNPPQISDSRVSFHKGLIQENFHVIESVQGMMRLIYLFDLDLYEPTKQVFDFIKPLLKSGDLLYFDEAFDSSGERRVILDEIIGNPRFTLVGVSNIAAAFKVL